MTNDGFHSYTYDAEGRITKVDSGTTATYAYDAFGHRVLTTLGSTATGFVFNAAGQRVSLWNVTTGSPIQGQYYWGSTPVAFHKSSAAHFQHQDWMGTERIRTEYNGTVEGTFTSLPFGDDLATASGTDTDAYHYGMLDHDYESDTEHAQFRQYNSAQGHWMSPDPYGGSYDISNPQSFNRYVYALDNPLSMIDPSGLNCVWDDGSQDDSPDDGGDDEASCEAAGGTWNQSNGGAVVVSAGCVNGICTTTLDVTAIDPSTCNMSNLACQLAMQQLQTTAPNNGPTWSQKNKGCLDKINSTPDGKFYNFMSPLSMIPGIGPEWKSSIAEDVGGGAAKFAVFKFFQGASQTMVRTPFGSMSGFVAGSIEGVAEGVLAPVAAAATVGQLTVHAGCAISAAF